MKRLLKTSLSVAIFSGVLSGTTSNVAHAAAVPSHAAEIYCTIIGNTQNLDCQWLGSQRKTMDADEISSFIDKARVAAYITIKSRKGLERTFMVDAKAPQFKRLSESDKPMSISELNKYKSNLFDEIEKKVVHFADELDKQSEKQELVLIDPSIANEKVKVSMHDMTEELDQYRHDKDKLCTATPSYERISKANAGMQKILSDMIVAFQTPGTCLSEVKVYRDKDGAVDLHQIESFPNKYKVQCKK